MLFNFSLLNKLRLIIIETMTPNFNNGTLRFMDLFKFLIRLSYNSIFGKSPTIAIKKFCLGEFNYRFIYLLSSGRAALYLLLKSIEKNEQNEIIIPAYTCIVIPNAIRYAGYQVKYVDIEEKTFNINIEHLQNIITSKTKAVVHQYTYGIPNNIVEVQKICNLNRILFIEDGAHALGAMYNDQYVGNFGDAAFFSFQASKMITTFSGGMLITNNSNIGKSIDKNYQKLKFIDRDREKQMIYLIIKTYFKTHLYFCYIYRRFKWFINKISPSLSCRIKNWFINPNLNHGEMEFQGEKHSNYLECLPESLQIILQLQLFNLKKDVKRRNRISKQMICILKRKGFKVPEFDSNTVYPSWNRFPILVDDRENSLREFNRLAIPVGDWFHYPLYQANEKTKQKNNYNEKLYPCAKSVSTRIINLPINKSVTNSFIKRLNALRHDKESNIIIENNP